MLAGGWTPFKATISSEAKKVFDKAMKGLTGVKYTPLAVATQVVAGTNYCFFCNAKVVYPDAPNLAALVFIFQPLEGAPHIVEIKKIFS